MTAVREQTKKRGFFLLKLNWTGSVNPGQFFVFETVKIMTVPLSVLAFENGVLFFVYKVKGRGTRELSELKEGDQVEMRGPFGMPYPAPSEMKEDIILVGGGTGAAPVHFYAAVFGEGVKALELGFREPGDEWFLRNLETACKPIFSYDSETSLFDKLKAEAPKKARYLVCGPTVFMELISKEFEYTQISVENIMPCGSGICYACTIILKDGRASRTCVDGPLYDSGQVPFSELAKLPCPL